MMFDEVSDAYELAIGLLFPFDPYVLVSPFLDFNDGKPFRLREPKAVSSSSEPKSNSDGEMWPSRDDVAVDAVGRARRRPPMFMQVDRCGTNFDIPTLAPQFGHVTAGNFVGAEVK